MCDIVKLRIYRCVFFYYGYECVCVRAYTYTKHLSIHTLRQVSIDNNTILHHINIRRLNSTHTHKVTEETKKKESLELTLTS